MVTRLERVVLELEDRFSRPTLDAAAAAKTLDKSLNDLDGSSVRAQRGVTGLEKPMVNIDRGGRLADRSINQLTGRLRVLRDVALTLGPGLVPLGAGGVAAIAGLTAQFGALAGAIGVSVLALNGIGDALDAVNAYQLEPTAENLAAVQAEFERLGPAGAEFVLYLESITPQLRELQMIAREGLLPGLAEGIDGFLSRGSQLNTVVSELATATGQLMASAGGALGGERFDAFFSYLETEAGPTLLEFGRSVGYIGEALANMLVAFSPVSSQFSSGLEGMTRSFAEWSRGLDENDSFQDFLSYIQQNGPAAVDFLGSLVTALAAVVEAAAPMGQTLLPALTAVLDVFAAIAGTPVGTGLLVAAAGFTAFNRAASVVKPALAGIGDALFLTDRAFTDAGRSAEKARASFLRTAGTAGVWAVAAHGVMEIVGGIDNLNRHLDTANAKMSDLAQVQMALADSNLGKYAAELGIDMQRLGEDLAENGRQGEYVQEVLAQLGDQGGGAISNLVDMLGTGQEALKLFGVNLGGNANEANMAGVALVRLLERYEETGEQAKGAAAEHERLTGELETTATSVDRLRDRLQAAREELKESRQDARGVAQSFVNLGDSLNDSSVSLNDWLRELEDNAAALRQFEANAQRAGRRGLDEGLVDSLRNAGSEGALRMRQLANATEGEIDRANAAWSKGQNAVKDFVNEVGGVKPKYVTRLEAEVDQAMAELARLRAYLDIPDEYVNVWVTRREVNSGGMGPQPSADGGTVPKTGRGYADRHLYLLADGEEVISNRDGQADRHRALLKAINAGRLADGGTAGRPRYSLDQRGDILGLERTLRDLVKALAKDGKDRLAGLDRKIALNELAQARRDLQAARNAPQRERNQAWREARSELDLGAGMSRGDVREEYAEFKRVLKQAGIELPKNFDALRDRAMDLADRFEKVSTKIGDTQESLEEWRERAKSVSDAVRSMFDNNIYARGGLANTMLQLEADRNDTNERNGLLQGVSGLAMLMGLDTSSAAFQSLATQADMQTLRDLDTAEEIQAFFDAYNARAQAQTDAAGFAADVITGAQIEALESTLDSLTATQQNIADKLDRLEERTEAGATRGTRNGAREGVKDGMRERERVKSAKARTR